MVDLNDDFLFEIVRYSQPQSAFDTKDDSPLGRTHDLPAEVLVKPYALRDELIVLNQLDQLSPLEFERRQVAL